MATLPRYGLAAEPPKVGAPLLVIVLLSILTVLLLLLFTAANPGGTLTALVLASMSMLVVLLCYRWLDRWEPEPRRLLQLAFLWGRRWPW